MSLYGNHTAPSAFPRTCAISIFGLPQDQHSSSILLICSLTWLGDDPDTIEFLLLDGRGGGGIRVLLDDDIVSMLQGFENT